jgi:regulator of RNase E activity RraA
MNELWKVLKDTEGPVVTLLKDIDSNPGRGASTGDGMSRNQKFYGVVGCIVDGTVRDVPGIKKVGLPVMGWGTVPGHGPFLLHSVNKPLVICDMEVSAGDIIFADLDGCCKVPVSHAEEIVACAGEIRRWESEVFEYFRSP